MKMKLRRLKALVLAGVMSVTFGREAKAIVVEEETLNKDKMYLSGEETLNNKDEHVDCEKEPEKEEILDVIANFYLNVYPTIKAQVEEEKVKDVAEVAANFYLNIYPIIKNQVEKEEAMKQAALVATNFYLNVYPFLREELMPVANPTTEDNDLTTTGDGELYLVDIAHNQEDEFKLIRK